MSEKWRMLLLLSIAELLAMAVWFSASAVTPTLVDVWQLDESGVAWLTMSVQIGFVVGAFGSAVLTLADRLSFRQLFSFSTLATAVLTALIPLIADGLALALILRFLTGVFLAGVYPVGTRYYRHNKLIAPIWAGSRPRKMLNLHNPMIPRHNTMLTKPAM